MPEDFTGDVWVFAKHSEQPELARRHLFRNISGQVIRVFQDIYTVDDADGYVALFDDVTHYIEVIPPAPPVTEANANLIAAAPELYEALDLLTLVVGLTPILGDKAALQEAVDIARATLKKARGE
jgi:hypothetical protein